MCISRINNKNLNLKCQNVTCITLPPRSWYSCFSSFVLELTNIEPDLWVNPFQWEKSSVENTVICHTGACAEAQGPGWGVILQMKDNFLYLLLKPSVFYLSGKITVLTLVDFGFHNLYDQQQRNLSLPMQTFCKEDSRKISHKWWSSADSLILPTLCVWWMLASLSSSRCWYRGSACPPAW